MGKPKPKRNDGVSPGKPASSEAQRGGGGSSSGKCAGKKRRRNHQTRGGGSDRGGGKRKPRKGHRVGDMTVILTRVELTDDHIHAPAPLVDQSVVAETAAGGTDASGPGLENSRVAKDTDVAPERKASPSESDNDVKDPEITPEESKWKILSPDVSTSNVADVVATNETKTETETEAEQSPADEARVSEDANTTVGGEGVAKSKERKPFINIVKSESAKGKLKLHYPKSNNETFTPLPDGDCGDGIKNPHPKEEVADKYWAQRRRLFSRYDEGIELDREGWYSVTPEAIANHVARRVTKIVSSRRGNAAHNRKGAVIIDAFCGCGGNAIAFARLGSDDVSLVICVDIDRSKLRMAAHNASIYGIHPNRLIFIEADAVLAMRTCYADGVRVGTVGNSAKSVDAEGSTTEVYEGYKIGGIDLLPEKIDAVFLSPPWGGMNYGKAGKMGYDIAASIQLYPSKHNGGKNELTKGQNLSSSEKVNGEDLLKIASGVTADKIVVYFLPRNTNGVFLGRSALNAGYRGSLELDQNYLNAKLKTVTAYLSRKVE